MGLDYRNLDADTRAYMAQELERDISSNSLYSSTRFTTKGTADFPDLFRRAAASGTDDTLATDLIAHGRIAQEEPNPRGGTKRVPHNAASLFAEGEFNRLYLRALCLRVIEHGGSLVVYRARTSTNPRKESEAKIGATMDPTALLADLRARKGVEPILGLPPGAGSGLSARIV